MIELEKIARKIMANSQMVKTGVIYPGNLVEGHITEKIYFDSYSQMKWRHFRQSIESFAYDVERELDDLGILDVFNIDDIRIFWSNEQMLAFEFVFKCKFGSSMIEKMKSSEWILKIIDNI